MKYSNLKILARNYVPTATVEQIDNVGLSLLLQQGALDVSSRLFPLKTNQKFASVANDRDYLLSSVLTRFLAIEKSGIWWSEDGSTNYVPLYPKTIEWLDKNRQNWRTESSGSPLYYAFDADEVIFSPPPASSTSQAFWVYFSQTPPEPNTDDWYPFGGEVEIPHLAPLSECILYYYKWKTLGILGKPDEMDKFEPVYEREILRKKKFLATRKDLSNSDQVKFMGRRIS